jgi:hypothetical protein
MFNQIANIFTLSLDDARHLNQFGAQPDDLDLSPYFESAQAQIEHKGYLTTIHAKRKCVPFWDDYSGHDVDYFDHHTYGMVYDQHEVEAAILPTGQVFIDGEPTELYAHQMEWVKSDW